MRLTVAKVCSVVEAAGALECHVDDLWEADDHLIAASATPIQFEFEVPLVVTKRLMFLSSRSSKPPLFKESGVLYQQTLRGVRELDPASARLLDELLLGA